MPAWQAFAELSPQRHWLAYQQPLPQGQGRSVTKLRPQPIPARDVGWWFREVDPPPDPDLSARFIRFVLAMDRLFVRLMTSDDRGRQGSTPVFRGDTRPRPTLEEQEAGARAARERFKVVGGTSS